MNFLWWISIAVLLIIAALATYSRKRGKKPRGAGELRGEKQRFHIQREHLEAKFLKLASARIDSESLRWADCEFENDVAYVRSRKTGELSALVAVTLTIEDEDVRDARTGTAVFRFDNDHWETDGRAILNLNPAEAVQFYRDDLEIVEEEFSHPA